MPSSVEPVARVVDQRDQRRDVASPASRAPSAPRAPSAVSGAVRMMRITSSILATAMARPTSDVGALARLVEQELGAPADHLLAERDEGLEHVRAGSSARGRPPFSATMLAPNEVCSGVKR